MSIICGALLPGFVLLKMSQMGTIHTTMAFSNTPGILKPINYRECETLSMANGINCVSKLALTINFISYAGLIRSSICTDTCVMKDPKPAMLIVEEAI